MAAWPGGSAGGRGGRKQGEEALTPDGGLEVPARAPLAHQPFEGVEGICRARTRTEGVPAHQRAVILRRGAPHACVRQWRGKRAEAGAGGSMHHRHRPSQRDLRTSVYATTLGTVRLLAASARTTALPSAMAATAEFEVPRSIPTSAARAGRLTVRIGRRLTWCLTIRPAGTIGCRVTAELRCADGGDLIAGGDRREAALGKSGRPESRAHAWGSAGQSQRRSTGRLCPLLAALAG